MMNMVQIKIEQDANGRDIVRITNQDASNKVFCRRCGIELTDPESKAKGIGTECLKEEQKESGKISNDADNPAYHGDVAIGYLKKLDDPLARAAREIQLTGLLSLRSYITELEGLRKRMNTIMYDIADKIENLK